MTKCDLIFSCLTSAISKHSSKCKQSRHQKSNVYIGKNITEGLITRIKRRKFSVVDNFIIFFSRHIFKIVMLYSIVNTEYLFHITREFVHSKTLDFLIANPIARIKIALFWCRYKSTKVLQTLKLFSELFIWPTFFWIYEVQKRFGIWPIWQEKSKGKIDTF